MYDINFLVSTVREKGLENDNFSRSVKSHFLSGKFTKGKSQRT